MQNSTLPAEENIVTVLKSFTIRLKLAYKILNTPKAIIILDNQIDIFNMEKNEVVTICANICSNMIQAEIDEDKINTLINKLVYSN